jgi:hypothetical protein
MGSVQPPARVHIRVQRVGAMLLGLLTVQLWHASAARGQSTTQRDTLSARPDSEASLLADPRAKPPVSEAAFPSASAGNAHAGGSSLLEATVPSRPDRPGILGDTGTYVYALSSSESEDVRAAIERTIAHMGLIPRQIARHRLVRANRPPSLITFAVGVETLAVTFDGLNPIVTPLTGEAVPWLRGTTHERYEVHVAFAGDTVQQVIATDDGERENDFLFLDGGATIEMHVILRAERLPTPLRYTEVFREVRGQAEESTPIQGTLPP